MTSRPSREQEWIVNTFLRLSVEITRHTYKRLILIPVSLEQKFATTVGLPIKIRTNRAHRAIFILLYSPNRYRLVPDSFACSSCSLSLRPSRIERPGRTARSASLSCPRPAEVSHYAVAKIFRDVAVKPARVDNLLPSRANLRGRSERRSLWSRRNRKTPRSGVSRRSGRLVIQALREAARRPRVDMRIARKIWLRDHFRKRNSPTACRAVSRTDCKIAAAVLVCAY